MLPCPVPEDAGQLSVSKGHSRRVRRWEPEPLRWLGVNTMYRAYHAADRAERNGRTGTSPLARAADLVSGR